MGDTRNAEFRHHATLMFADLCDYTALTEAVDPEEVAPLLRRVRAVVGEIVRKHHGFINEWRGDGVLCMFGLPVVTEEAPRHALEAALEMHAAIKSIEPELEGAFGFELRLHSGIDSGLVFAHPRGEADGYDVIGDAVNTAARLCARAGRDEVWVSRQAIEGFDPLFSTGPIERLALKGKKGVVDACLVRGLTGIKSRFGASQQRGLTPLVGREVALQSLSRSLDRALAGELQLTTVFGSAGIGKTRTLEEFKRRISSPISVLEGRCESQPSASILQPFLDIVSEVLRSAGLSSASADRATVDAILQKIDPELGKHRDALLHLIGWVPLAPPPGVPELVQRAFVDAVVALLGGLTSQRPLTLMLDDWQWADDVSRQVLGSVMRELRNASCLIVIASRDVSDPLLAAGEVVGLEPLTQEESARIIAAILPFSLNLGLTRTIHERAGGNPLFLEELCRALPSEAASSEEDLVGSRVPSTLRGIIQVRAERLPEEPAKVLHAAAVVGSEVAAGLLSRLVETSDLDGALRILVESDLIHPANAQGGFRFKHWTTREVVYESVRLPERRRLHAKISAVLEAQANDSNRAPPLEELAYHLEGSGDHQRAAQFSELAGDRASASSSLDRARQHYAAALRTLEKLDQNPILERRWIAIVDKWAAASLYSPAREHLAVIQRAGERALQLGDGVSAARAEYWLSWFSYALGDQPVATQYCRSALARAEAANDQRLAEQLLLTLGQSLAAAGEYGEALAHFASGIETKRRRFRSGPTSPRQERRPPLAFAYALACKGLLHADLGQFDESYGCFNEALDSLHGTGHAVEGSCFGLLGMAQLLQGQWQAAFETAKRAQATAERINGPYVFAMSKTVSGYARWVQERNSTALTELLQAVKWMETRGIRLFISFNYAYLADALASAGDIEQARDYAERALSRATQSDRLGEPMAHRTLARITMQLAGPLAQTRRHLDSAMNSARARQSAREIALTSVDLAGLHLACGERDQAAQNLVAARRIFHQLGMNYFEQRAHHLLTAG